MKFLKLKVIALLCVCSLINAQKKQTALKVGAVDKQGYTNLYNGHDMDNWNIMCRDKQEGLAARVFTAGENGEMHVFKNFPDEYGFIENKSGTHCMFFTNESYSRYSFKFEYKWGTKRYNNFSQFQYDAGLYFHVFDVAIWPKGIEYQVRYDHTKNENHTGDIWNSGADFDWTSAANEDSKSRTYLSPKEGGIPQEHKQGEHKAYKNAPFHALDGQWNQCEVIVMGNKYAIYKLNGKVVNVITNLSHSEGSIGLQAETAEVFYRNIKIKEFKNDIPMDVFLK
ncbi:3-keto-disaccharide hydrolase [Flavobacterium sp. ARAG 55.4]|uniref:3-keto-disaccharide hydrolase n=1 Tax=Flavobacterium sp. ARAG 55.4 TaxID=3451357 RepID=UPI003F482B48